MRLGLHATVALMAAVAPSSVAADAGRAMLQRCVEEIHASVSRPQSVEVLSFGEVTIRPSTLAEYMGTTHPVVVGHHANVLGAVEGASELASAGEMIFEADRPDLWQLPITFQFQPAARPARTVTTICSINLAPSRHSMETLRRGHKVYLDGATHFHRLLYSLMDDF